MAASSELSDLGQSETTLASGELDEFLLNALGAFVTRHRSDWALALRSPRSVRLKRPPTEAPSASVLAYTRAKDTNLGKEHTGNGCQSGYTLGAAPRRNYPAPSSQLFLLGGSSSFRGEQLQRRSAL